MSKGLSLYVLLVFLEAVRVLLLQLISALALAIVLAGIRAAPRICLLSRRSLRNPSTDVNLSQVGRRPTRELSSSQDWSSSWVPECGRRNLPAYAARSARSHRMRYRSSSDGR